MSFKANVNYVFIASPSDVTKEREIVRESISEWNALHSFEKKTILLPIGWEKNVYPILENRPQESINRQILESADILIGIFWTRLGTPTGDFESGSVEEIKKHYEAGKPTMIYFSSQPVKLDSVDPDQYQNLLAFKEWCQSKGIIENFESDTELFRKLNRHLTLLSNDHELFQNNEFVQKDQDSFAKSAPKEEITNSIVLTEDEQMLLKEISQDYEGSIRILFSSQGKSYNSNRKSFTSTTLSPARFQAEMDSMIQKFENLQLISPTSAKRNIYKLTANGYKLADSL